MLDIHHESSEALLSRVLAACRDTERLAVQLAQGAPRESLRLLLQERAASYRGAASELERSGCHLAFIDGGAPDMPGEALHRHADVDSIWEAIECSTLICFRDALDARTAVRDRSARASMHRRRRQRTRTAACPAS